MGSTIFLMAPGEDEWRVGQPDAHREGDITAQFTFETDVPAARRDAAKLLGA